MMIIRVVEVKVTWCSLMAGFVEVFVVDEVGGFIDRISSGLKFEFSSGFFWASVE